MLEGGQEFRFGTRVVVLYPLSLKQLRGLRTELQAISRISAETMSEQFDMMLKIFLASAKRGDPSVTEEDVEAVIDMSNLQRAIEVCISQKVMNLGEAVRPQSRQTGGASLQALPTQLDGATIQSES